MNGGARLELQASKSAGDVPYLPEAAVMLAVHQRLLDKEIRTIGSYLETVGSAFRRESGELQRHVAAVSSGLEEGRAREYAEDSFETFDDLTCRFPAFAYQTTFVATYTLLEDEMFRVARTLRDHLAIKLNPEDLNHKGIFAAKLYLESLCAVEFPTNGRPWQEVNHYNRLRNVIVHARGRIKGSRNEKAIRNYARSNGAVTIDNFDRLLISEAFCCEVLGNIQLLLEELFRLAQDKVNSTS